MWLHSLWFQKSKPELDASRHFVYFSSGVFRDLFQSDGHFFKALIVRLRAERLQHENLQSIVL